MHPAVPTVFPSKYVSLITYHQHVSRNQFYQVHPIYFNTRRPNLIFKKITSSAYQVEGIEVTDKHGQSFFNDEKIPSFVMSDLGRRTWFREQLIILAYGHKVGAPCDPLHCEAGAGILHTQVSDNGTVNRTAFGSPDHVPRNESIENTFVFSRNIEGSSLEALFS